MSIVMVDDVHPAPAPAAALDVTGFKPGVFFSMPEEEYHSIPALSASGIKNLRMSPLDFWARASWLNPNYDEENEDNGDSFAQILGRAYHKRILEGLDAFQQSYALAFDPSMFKGALKNADEIKGALRAHKERGVEGIKLTANKDDLISQLLSVEPTAKIMDVIEDGYLKHHEGKTFIPAKYRDQIELAAAMIERDPELGKLFRGGAPEVSVFFNCRDTGIPCKARFDSLKPRGITDLKSFANKMGLPVDVAIAREFANNRYAFQAAFYLDAATYIAPLIKAGLVYGEASPEMMRGLAAGHPKTFTFVFTQKGVAPIARGRRFLPGSTIFTLAKAKIDDAKLLFRQCMDHYGKDPWVSPAPIDDFRDEEVPLYATD
jgi:hypothetical protein